MTVKVAVLPPRVDWQLPVLVRSQRWSRVIVGNTDRQTDRQPLPGGSSFRDIRLLRVRQMTLENKSRRRNQVWGKKAQKNGPG